MKELIKIQSELNAPKNLFNKFGKYHYRNAEGILEALKPLLKKNECFIIISDEVVSFEGVSVIKKQKYPDDNGIMLENEFESVGRVYVKATATIYNSKGESVSSTAFAREAESQKGMDSAMLTGSASSYARKYALNGLLAIDDNKDPDDLGGMEESQKPKANPKSKAVAPKVAPKPAPVANQEIPKEVRQKVADVTSREDVARIWTDYAYLRSNQEFNELIKQASALFPKEK